MNSEVCPYCKGRNMRHKGKSITFHHHVKNQDKDYYECDMCGVKWKEIIKHTYELLRIN